MKPRANRSFRAVSRCLVFAALLLPWASCAGVRVSTTTHGEQGSMDYRGYAWSSIGPSVASDGSASGQPDIDAAFREAVQEQLDELGLRVAARERADVLVAMRVEVVEKVRSSDPYFTGNPSERVEIGRLTLELIDVVDARPVWDGTARVVLRELSRGVGVGEPKYREVDQDRDWPVATMVRRLLDRSPLAR